MPWKILTSFTVGELNDQIQQVGNDELYELEADLKHLLGNGAFKSSVEIAEAKDLLRIVLEERRDREELAEQFGIGR